MAVVEVSAVKTRKDLKAFINLPWQIYRDYPNWIPPVKFDVAHMLNPRKHPFWKDSYRELFIARKGDQVLGRIAAMVDGTYNQYHDEKMAIWGFFECMQDHEAAQALFVEAENWARAQQMAFLRGPMNPSTNHELGLLIQGFDTPPVLMMTYNPPYYLELVHACRYRKEKDLISYRFDPSFRPADWTFELAERLTQKSDFTIRRPKKWRSSDIGEAGRIYNECWADNWGFVPMNDGEIKELAKALLLILDPDLAFFLDYKEEAVGVAIVIPDANPLLKRLNGSIGFGIGALIKKYRYRHEINGLRGLIFGIKKKYRQMGVPLVAFSEVYRVLRQKPQYKYVEMGWDLEDNYAINRLYEENGARISKRYRIYRKDL